MVKNSDNFMSYNGKPYTNILKNTNSDAKLKYLNIKDFFQI